MQNDKMLNRMREDQIATPWAHQLIYDVNICIRLRLLHCQVSGKGRVATEYMKTGQPSTFHHIHVEGRDSKIFSSTQIGKFCTMYTQHVSNFYLISLFYNTCRVICKFYCLNLWDITRVVISCCIFSSSVWYRFYKKYISQQAKQTDCLDRRRWY